LAALRFETKRSLSVLTPQRGDELQFSHHVGDIRISHGKTFVTSYQRCYSRGHFLRRERRGISDPSSSRA